MARCTLTRWFENREHKLWRYQLANLQPASSLLFLDYDGFLRFVSLVPEATSEIFPYRGLPFSSQCQHGKRFTWINRGKLSLIRQGGEPKTNESFCIVQLRLYRSDPANPKNVKCCDTVDEWEASATWSRHSNTCEVFLEEAGHYCVKIVTKEKDALFTAFISGKDGVLEYLTEQEASAHR